MATNDSILNNGFKFNLLPRKSRVELELTRERDDSFLYAVGIVFFASVVWVGTSLVLTNLIGPRINQTRRGIDTLEAQISNLASVQESYGEMVIKTQQLRPVVEKRLDPVTVFAIADALVLNAGPTGIITYSTKSYDTISFQINSSSFEALSQIVTNARNLESVKAVELQSAIKDIKTNLITSTIELKLNVSS